MPSKKLIAIVTVAALAVVGGATAIAVNSAVAESAPLAVTAYADSSTTVGQLAKSSGALTTVAIDGVTITGDGSGVTSPSSADLTLLDDAHARGIRVELVVSNYDDGLGDFSPSIAAELLSSPYDIDTVVTALVAEVDEHDWDGITVDLESLQRTDAAGLTRFVRALNKALGPDRTLAVCLTATTGNYGDLGYQLGSLAKTADRLVLMAYDQHGPWGTAGPVGGTPWVSKALAPLLQKVKPSRIDLGIAGYGYRWPGDGSKATQLSDREARSAASADGATAGWNAKQKEWRATLADGTVIWWSDKRTFAARYALARQLHLNGVAVWSLSLSDPIAR